MVKNCKSCYTEKSVNKCNECDAGFEINNSKTGCFNCPLNALEISNCASFINTID